MQELTDEEKVEIKEKTLPKEADDNPNVITHLEDHYPLHDRREQGYKLVGFHGTAKPSIRNRMHYPYGKVPIWRYLGWDMNTKYDGAKLRELRAKNGVGKVKKSTD